MNDKVIRFPGSPMSVPPSPPSDPLRSARRELLRALSLVRGAQLVTIVCGQNFADTRTPDANEGFIYALGYLHECFTHLEHSITSYCMEVSLKGH